MPLHKLCKYILYGCKYTFTLSCLLAVPGASQAQSLTLANLLAMQRSGLTVTNDLLLTRGWVFLGENVGAPKDCDFQELTWSSSEKDDYNRRSKGYFHLYKHPNCTNGISYQTSATRTANSLKAAAYKNGMRLLTTKVVKSLDGTPEINEIYKKGDIILEAVTSSAINTHGERTSFCIFRLYQI